MTIRYIHLRKILLVSLILCSFITSAIGETVIYDTVTPSDMKFFIIDDDVNIKYLNEFKYEILLDGYSIGEYSKGEKIYYTDNSNISIISPNSNIDTDVSNIWDVGRTNFYIALMYVGGFLVMIIFVFLIFRRRWGRR